MKFNISSKLLHSTLATVGRVINSKNALQILDNFLFTVAGNELTITAMDVENMMSATLQLDSVEGEGSFCVDARRVLDLFKEIPDQGVTVDVDERLNVKVTYSSGESSFIALPGVEYPGYEGVKDEGDAETVKFALQARQIVAGIENTLFATSNDDYRPAMMGVYLDVKPDDVTFVATDTRKLVRYTDSRHRPGVTTHCILAPKPANILKSFLADGGEELVQIEMTSRGAEFRTDRFVLNCRFILGAYPDYNRVIPKSNNSVLTIDRQTLLTSVRRIVLFCDPTYKLEKFSITPDELTIKAEDPNVMTRICEKMPCSFTGEHLIIGFGGSHLAEILNVLHTQDVVVELGDSARPGIFRPTENEADTDLLILLMPMTVGEF